MSRPTTTNRPEAINRSEATSREEPGASRAVVSRPGAVAAVTFGLLVIIDGATTGHPPDPDKPVSQILSWYSAHRLGTFTMELLLVVASGLLLWFAADLRRAVSTRSARSATASGCFVAASAALAALFVAGGWAQTALALAAGRRGPAPADTVVRLLSDMTWFRWAGTYLVIAVAAVSLAVTVHDSLRRNSVVWIGALSAGLSLIGGITSFYPAASGHENELGLLGYLGMVAFAIAVLLNGALVLIARARS